MKIRPWLDEGDRTRRNFRYMIVFVSACVVAVVLMLYWFAIAVMSLGVSPWTSPIWYVNAPMMLLILAAVLIMYRHRARLDASRVIELVQGIGHEPMLSLVARVLHNLGIRHLETRTGLRELARNFGSTGTAIQLIGFRLEI